MKGTAVVHIPFLKAEILEMYQRCTLEVRKAYVKPGSNTFIASSTHLLIESPLSPLLVIGMHYHGLRPLV